MIQPVMLYGLETAPQTNKTAKRLEVAEMKMCRWACGVTRRVRVSKETNGNEEHRFKVQTRETEMVWTRKEEECVGNWMLSKDPSGKRKRGRPKQRWMDNTNADMRSVGGKEEDMQVRKIWKMFISTEATP
ncbi:uncharacterized protein LOC134765774 [Penaeus indicus]|uniref:uncharacterized protein LOC134765774 n=1 Tax=Penaeus indicus TaxID=29960 RepID=UPI00300CB791